MKDVKFIKDEFFYKCTICEGSGFQQYVGECQYCKGSGYRLTELGEELLKVIKSYLFR